MFTLGDPTGGVNGYRSCSSLQDTVTPKGHRRAINACVHLTNHGASDFSEQKFQSLYSWAPDPFQRTTPLRCSIQWWPGYLALPEPDLGEYLHNLVGQLNGAIQNGSLLGVTLLEVVKTAQMMSNPFSLLSNSFASLIASKRFRRSYLRRLKGTKSLAHFARRAADYHLEFKYGWQALMYDIRSFCKTTADVFTPAHQELKDSLSQRYSAGSRLTVDLPEYVYPGGYTEHQWESDWYGSYPYGGPFNWVRVKPGKAEVTYRIGCRQMYRQLNTLDKFYRIFHAYGLTADDLFTTLWEAMPYSFVVDWFVNLRGLTSTFDLSRLSVLGATDLVFSSKLKIDYMIEWKLPPPSWVYGAIWNPAYQCVGNTCSRSATAGVYTSYQRSAGFSNLEDIRAVCFSQGLSTAQTVSGIALILQKLFR